jgi:glutamate synthase (NADPH/NADH) small chain
MQFEEPYGSAANRPATADGGHYILPVDIVVKVLGEEPRLDVLRWIEGLDMEWGRPRVDAATGQTTNPKYFADGAVLDGCGPILAAVRAGKRAARGIDRWLREPYPIS